MKQRIYILLLLSFLFLIVTSCLKKQSEQQIEPIRIGYVPYSSSLPALVANEAGIFKSKKLNVQLERFETSNEGIIALTQGHISGLMGIGFPSLLAIEVKTPGTFKMIWYVIEDDKKSVNALLVPIKSEITTIDQLRNKTVGTFSGATQLLNLQAIFKTALGDANAAMITQVSPNLQLQALQNGDVTALFTIEPYVTMAIMKGIGRVLIENPRCKYIINPFPGGGGVLSTAFITKNPKEAGLLRDALNEAINRIESDESSAKALLPKYIPVEEEVAVKTKLYGWWTSSQVNLQDLQNMANLLERDGIIDGHVDIQNILMNEQI